MKTKIISLVLATVMLVLTLAGCGGGFNPVNEDLSKYATFDANGFKEALQKIEITDGDFTTNETVRAEKVAESIYSAIADAYIKAAKDEDKLKEGVLDASDVLYYCFYTTYTDADGVEHVFNSASMSVAAVTASATAKNHVIRLGDFDDDDELQAKIAEAIENASVDGKIYSTNATKGTTLENIDKVVIAFKRECEREQLKEGSDTETETVTVKETVLYQTIDLSDTTNPIATFLLDTNTVASVGNTVKVKAGEGSNATEKTTFVIKHGDVDYTYSNFSIKWIVEEEGAPIAEIKHTPYDTETKLEPDAIHTDGTKIDLKDKELTYHIYPVYYYDVPETDATAIVKYVFGSKITTSSLEAFGDETYKNGTVTVKTLIENLSNLYSEKFDEESTDETIKNLIALKKAFEEAEDAFDDADDPSEELENALDKAEADYDKALEEAIDADIKKLLEASSADKDEDEKKLSDAVVKEYTEDKYHTLKESYDSEILKSVGSAVYALLEEYVKITAYPEDLVEEFRNHLYESYEYKFYKEDYDSNNSNYKYYGGDLQKYLLAATGATKDHNGDIEAALIAEAKSLIDPMIRVYTVAKALEAEAKAALPVYVQKDIDQKAYDSFYEDDKDKTAEENKAAKDEADKKAKENADKALEDAATFLITDDAFNAYKNRIGAQVYKTLEEQYGERNVRTALQFNKLFYYLLSNDYKVAEDADHVEVLYKDDGAGNIVLSFRTLNYSIKAETEDSDSTDGE